MPPVTNCTFHKRKKAPFVTVKGIVIKTWQVSFKIWRENHLVKSFLSFSAFLLGYFESGRLV
jgi:hypothetical protein